MSFFNLDFLPEYIANFNIANPENQITPDIIIERPKIFNNEEFEQLCATPSMKRGLTYFVKQYNEQTFENPIFDILVLTTNHEKGAFIFVKKLLRCVSNSPKSYENVISIEGICSIKPGAGKILLGFTIFNALRKNADLILQVDNGYENTTAYCLYSSMGFEIDINIIPSCYNFDKTKLVMRLSNEVNEANMFSFPKKEFCINRELQTQENKLKRQINYILTQLEPLKLKTKREIIRSLELGFLLRLINNNIEIIPQILKNDQVVDLITNVLIDKSKEHDPEYTFLEGGKNKTKKHKKYKKSIKKNKTRKYKNKKI